MMAKGANRPRPKPAAWRAMRETSAVDLSQQAETLKRGVDGFIMSVRAGRPAGSCGEASGTGGGARVGLGPNPLAPLR